MGKTKIEWTDYALNPYKWYCTKVSQGCKNCYMMALAERYPQHAAQGIEWRANIGDELRTIPSGSMVFVNDMSDTFHERAPLEYIQRIFRMANNRPDLVFQILTKRIARAAELHHLVEWTPNIWMGTSVENADVVKRIDYLRKIPAAVRFISFEPLIGDVGQVDLSGIHWAITGAESGSNRRPFDPAWARSIRLQCQQQRVAFFHKQGSAQTPGQNRLLDGRLWEELPAGFVRKTEDVESKQLRLF